jgi:hypothetical protein
MINVLASCAKPRVAAYPWEKRTLLWKMEENGPCLIGGDWNMNFMTFHILGMSSSQLTNSYFSEGQVYHQPDLVR